MNTRIIAILLIVLWVLQSISPSLVYTIGRWVIKTRSFNISQKEVKQINKETIHFSLLEDVNWEVKGKELSMNGILYDVISIEDVDDGIDIICFSGIQENNFVQLINEQKEKHRSDNVLLKQVFKNKIIFQDNEENTNMPWRKCNVIVQVGLMTSDLVIRPDIPPPKT